MVALLSSIHPKTTWLPVLWISDDQTCIGQTEIFKGQSLLPYIYNVSFNSSTGNKVNFDNKVIRGKYGIVNYQVQIKQNDFRLADVITWDEPHGNQKPPNETCHAEKRSLLTCPLAIVLRKLKISNK